MQPPPPPSITPHQMNLLRVVTSMAWADGELAQEEVDLMLDRLSGLFAKESTQKEALSQELRDYLMQNIPPEESIAKLVSQEEKELVLQLGYEVIAASARTPDEPKINAEEAEAYKKLVKLLNLPEEAVKRVEKQGKAGENSDTSLVDKLTEKMEKFMGG
ncbi:TerB family tellurite resistance protein [Ancylothrix sp. C2]|uniref:tellurite resistance TerB family protein n=1 Tax=Ancylothrix sp. D3o TaxID=2953691 RepID=UPI0021BB57D0|nr:TerB family tellurite resistance protein [Ancylothrix sp. D3o]MCT7951733.1 TerB family tellurite resistance protein [Ancylothrix sp. D3o]